MASPSDAYAREAAARKQNKAAPFKFLVPLIYAPVLPLIRISLRKNPVLRDRVFTVVLAGAFVHGFYLVQHQNGFVRFGEQVKLQKASSRKICAHLLS